MIARLVSFKKKAGGHESRQRACSSLLSRIVSSARVPRSRFLKASMNLGNRSRTTAFRASLKSGLVSTVRCIASADDTDFLCEATYHKEKVKNAENKNLARLKFIQTSKLSK